MINKKQVQKDEKRKYIKCRISDEMYRQLISITTATGLCISDVVRLGLSAEITRLKERFKKDDTEESELERFKRQAHENAMRRAGLSD